MNEKKRLFFGAEIKAPWFNDNLPEGRIIKEENFKNLFFEMEWVDKNI